MCDTCGCVLHIEPASHVPGYIPISTSTRLESERLQISVLEGILAENNLVAQHNREHFNEHGVLAINLMSSPGSGKTTLLESTLHALSERVAVIVGDLATENDANRLRHHGVKAVQINTGNACHLDAQLVHHALHEIDLQQIDFLFIENVGNLVCPASYDLGQHINVVLLSVVEGDDKPSKYPVIFRTADLVLFTKSDLLPYLPNFDPLRAETNIRYLANSAPTYLISAITGVGTEQWLTFLQTKRIALKQINHIK